MSPFAQCYYLVRLPTLVQRLRERSPGLTGDDASLEPLLTGGLDAARARWPEIRLADDRFLAHLADRLGACELARLALPDLFLACACIEGDRAALAVLEHEVLGQIPRWVRHVAGAATEDVQQELRQQLLVGPEPRLASYNGSTPLASWLRVIAVRRAIDHRRAKKPEQDSGELEDLWVGPDPELDAIKVHDALALRNLLHQALQALPPGARNLLRLHYLEGISLERLAIIERVHRATVARRIADARDQVLDSVREGLSRTLRLSPDEGDSLLRFVRSRIELSLRRAFAEDSPP
jgi:RNA polymerase sigma-70 factor (ECF subfamily)